MSSSIQRRGGFDSLLFSTGYLSFCLHLTHASTCWQSKLLENSSKSCRPLSVTDRYFVISKGIRWIPLDRVRTVARIPIAHQRNNPPGPDLWLTADGVQTGLGILETDGNPMAYVPKLHKVRKCIRKAFQNQLRQESIDEDRPSMVLGYRRCSHQDSEESGLGLSVQGDRIAAYTALLLVDHPELRDGEPSEDYSDLVVSAWKHPFRSRPRACAMLVKAQRGDHIVVAEMTRAFRNVKDCLDTIDYLKHRGIVLHFADLKIDFSTAQGRFTAIILAAVAELSSHQKSERGKAINRAKRKRGVPIGSRPPVGWRFKGKGFHRVLIPDLEHRKIMDKILEWRERDGLGWNCISDMVESHLAEQEGRESYRRTNANRKWGTYRCRIAYVEAAKIRDGATVLSPPE